jgi:hypothetical protein
MRYYKMSFFFDYRTYTFERYFEFNLSLNLKYFEF